MAVVAVIAVVAVVAAVAAVVVVGQRLIKKPCLKSPILFLECGRLWRYGVYYGLAVKIKGILRFCLFAYMKTKAHMSV